MTPSTPSSPEATATLAGSATSEAPWGPVPGPSPDLAQIVRDYARAARAYDAVAERLWAAAPAAEALEVGEPEARTLAIAHGCAADYLGHGAQAARDVAERLRVWASLPSRDATGLDAGVAEGSPAVTAAVVADAGSGEGRLVAEVAAVPSAEWYERAAVELCGWVDRLADDAEAATTCTGDRTLVGDTHPYGDVIYGIVIPYLLQAADVLGRIEGASS